MLGEKYKYSLIIFNLCWRRKIELNQILQNNGISASQFFMILNQLPVR